MIPMFTSSGSARPGAWRSVALLGLGLLVSIGGCSGKSGDADDLVLARVGDEEIRADYYKTKLAKFKPDELPRGEDGEPMDTATMEGKQAFLAALINKELMQLKAHDLGYAEDSSVRSAIDQLSTYHASNVFYMDSIEVPAGSISHEEVDAYYARLGESRVCQFLITNFRDDALAARAEIEAGADWEDAVKKYHEGATPQSGIMEMTIPWGQNEDTFEREIFQVAKGEVTQPIQSSYGFWLMRPIEIKHGEKKPLEEIQVRVLNSIRQRKMNLTKRDFNREIRSERNFDLNKESLWICYEALPRDESMFLEGTQTPTPREYLKPLAVDETLYDRFLFSYESNDGTVTVTIGDYKETFDRMNVFQRPKWSDMLGGFRNRLLSDMDKQIMTQEALKRGYKDDPRVQELVWEKAHEMMVTKLHADIVKVDEEVTGEDIKAFWADHKDDYYVPEGRQGRLIIVANEEQAELVARQLRAGRDFDRLLQKFGIDEKNKQKGGKFQPVRAHSSGPFVEALFATPAGGVTNPVPHKGRFIVAVVDSLVAPVEPSMVDRSEDISRRIVMRRKDDFLNEMLVKWREEYGVEIDKGALAKMPSWETVTTPQPLENQVS